MAGCTALCQSPVWGCLAGSPFTCTALLSTALLSASRPLPPHPPESRQLNRDLFYTVVRAVIVIAAAVVFATLYEGQGSGVDTFTQVLNVAGSM